MPYVPDEEAARSIERFLQIVAPEVGRGAWPAWDPGAAPAGVWLPGRAGACVYRSPTSSGRPVLGRAGQAVPGLLYLPAAAVAVQPQAVAGPAEVARIGGQRVVLLRDGQWSPFAAAEAFYRTSFARWGEDQGSTPAEPPAPEPLEDAAPEQTALGEVEGQLLLALWRQWRADALPQIPPLAAGSLAPSDGAAWRRTAHALALVRRQRRAPLDDAWIARERQAEVRLGLPAYVGRACALRLGAPPEADPIAASLHDLGYVTPQARGLAAGAALALLLQVLWVVSPGAPPGRRSPQVLADWRVALQTGAVPDLDALLEHHVAFDGGPRDDAMLEATLRAHRYQELLRRAQAHWESVRRARAQLWEAILQGEGTLLVCDISALGRATVSSPQPPQAVHGHLHIYPVGGTFRFASGATVVVRGIPVAHDGSSGLLHARIRAHPAFSADGAVVQAAEALGFDEGLELRLPGLQVTAHTGEIRPIEGGFWLRLLR